MLCYLHLVVNSEVENITRKIEVDTKITPINTIRNFNNMQPLQIEKTFSSLSETLLLISVFILTQVKDLKDLFLYLFSMCREVKSLPFYNAMRQIMNCGGLYPLGF